MPYAQYIMGELSEVTDGNVHYGDCWTAWRNSQLVDEKTAESLRKQLAERRADRSSALETTISN